MNLKNVRHLREILVTDAHGKTSSKIQYSSQSGSHFRPQFVEVPFEDQARARELYFKWGGTRRPELKFGMTVTIPDHQNGEASSASKNAIGETERYGD